MIATALAVVEGCAKFDASFGRSGSGGGCRGGAGEVAAWAADWFHERQLPPEMLLLERALSMCLSIGIGLSKKNGGGCEMRCTILYSYVDSSTRNT